MRTPARSSPSDDDRQAWPGMSQRTAIVVPGHRCLGPDGVHRISTSCLRLVARGRAVVGDGSRSDVVVFSGWSSTGGPSEAEQMRDAWRGPAGGARRRADGAASRPRTRRARCRCSLERGIEAGRRRLLAAARLPRRACLLRPSLRQPAAIAVRVPRRAHRVRRCARSRGSSRRCRSCPCSCARRARELDAAGRR